MKVGDIVHGLQNVRNDKGKYVDEAFSAVVKLFHDGLPMVAIDDTLIIPLHDRSARKTFYCRPANNPDAHWYAVHAGYGHEAACRFVEQGALPVIGHPVDLVDGFPVWAIEVWWRGDLRSVKVKVRTATTYEAIS